MSRILVVDDEPHIRKLVTFTLESRGHEVIEAEDGLSGIDKAASESPDLILLDVMMPVLDGLETARRLRDDPNTTGIPICMLSAKSQTYEQEAGLESGATSYVCKPFSPKDLAAKVSELLGDPA